MSDPWENLDVPAAATVVNARLVDSESPHDLYWGIDAKRRCLLILEHKESSRYTAALPRFQDLELYETEGRVQGTNRLVLALNSRKQRDLFRILCQDIANAIREVAVDDPKEASVFVTRTWRWHSLLKRGRISRLSPEEQKGLIGEIDLLEELLLSMLSAKDSVDSWTGPLGAPKDFQIGRVCIEVKARAGAAQPFVRISSVDQLDTSGVDHLFLRVVELDRGSEGSAGAITLTTKSQHVMELLAREDQIAATLFESRLYARGFTWDQDYEDCRWIAGQRRQYRVSEGFPRITAKTAGPGVSAVTYKVSLAACEEFAVPPDTLEQCTKEQANATES